MNTDLIINFIIEEGVASPVALKIVRDEINALPENHDINDVLKIIKQFLISDDETEINFRRICTHDLHCERCDFCGYKRGLISLPAHMYANGENKYES